MHSGAESLDEVHGIVSLGLSPAFNVHHYRVFTFEPMSPLRFPEMQRLKLMNRDVVPYFGLSCPVLYFVYICGNNHSFEPFSK